MQNWKADGNYTILYKLGIKKRFNTLVLSMEGRLRETIEADPDPLGKAFAYARIGNYIDFSFYMIRRNMFNRKEQLDSIFKIGI